MNQASTVDAELSRTSRARSTPQSTVTTASGSKVGQLTVSSATTEVAVSEPTGEAQIRRVSRSTAGMLMTLEIAPALTTAGPHTNSDPRRISTVASRSEARLSTSTVTTPPAAVQACPVRITGSNPGGLTVEDPLGAGPGKCPVQAGIVGSGPFEVPFGVFVDREGDRVAVVGIKVVFERHSRHHRRPG